MKKTAFLGVLLAFTGLSMGTSHCATDLKITIPGDNVIQHNGATSATISTMADLHKYMLKCADTVESLDLRVTLMGCSEEPDRWNFPFKMAGGERYPNLTSLRLEGYEFDEIDSPYMRTRSSFIEKGRQWLGSFDLPQGLRRWLDLPADGRACTNLELWLDAMDWSMLQRLEVAHVDEAFVDVVAPRLLELRHFASDAQSWRDKPDHTARFISSLPHIYQLESLAWRRGSADDGLREALVTQGGFLKRLDLSNDNPISEVDGLSVDQVELIARLAPRLEEISIAIHRDGSWPLETLKTFGTLQNLNHANISMELTSNCTRDLYDTPTHGGLCQGDKLRQPELSETTAMEIYKTILDAKHAKTWETGESSSNLIVDLKSGDFSRAWDGPLYLPSLYEGVRKHVSCSMEPSTEKLAGADPGMWEPRCDVVKPQQWSTELDDDWVYAEMEL